MVKFIKLKVNSRHEYFNASGIIGVTKSLVGGLTGAILRYETNKSPAYTLIAYGGGSIMGDYIIEAVMNANSSSHTSNVYYPEITQGTQPSIDNVS